MKRYLWIGVALAVGLLWAFTALARLPSSQTNARGIYIQYDNVFDNLDRDHNYPVAGGHERWGWNELEPGYDNDYRFEEEIRVFVNQQVSRGKRAAIGIETFVGRINQTPPYGSLAVPQWLWQTYPNVALWNVRGGGTAWYTLNYLDANYQAKYAEFVNALADWLAANPDVAGNISWLEIGVGMYSETQPSDQWVTANWPDYIFYADDPPGGLGWSGNDWLGYVNWCTDTYYNAFRVRQPSLSSIALFLNCAPDFKGVRDQFTDHAAQKEVGLKNNGLQSDRAPYYLYGPLEKWGTVLPEEDVPIAWETYEQWLTNEVEFYWGMLCALDKHPDVMLPERWLMINHDKQPLPRYVEVWDWVDDYLAVNPGNTPGVWCALRETEFGNGEPGNFSFFLFQDDSYGPNGATVARYNETPGQREGRYTRRTDQSSGNRYMWFRIADQFVNGNGGGATFTVNITYLDRGTDTWQLWYDSFTGEKSAGSVQKTNSGTWKKKAFVLTDARFGNGMGDQADLKLDCNVDGDDFFHLVEVRRSGVGPTPTPTNTGTPCSIQGSVSLQGRPSPPHARWQVPLLVTVCGNPYQVSTDPSGNFTVQGLTPGTCDIVVKNGHTLSNRRRNYTLVNGVNSINMGELKEGDANNDDTVNSSDFLLLRGSYFKSVGQPGFVDGADFNEDDIVNSSDFLLLRSNYFDSGPIDLGGAQGAAAGSTMQADASSTVGIAIEPASTTVQVGEEFDLDVRIDAGATEVAVADVFMNFDPSALEVVDIRDGETWTMIAKFFDNDAGTIDFGAGTLSAPNTGSFVVATLRLRAKRSTQGGTTPVAFSLALPRQTVVKDVDDHDLLGTSSDGAVRVGASVYSVYLSCIKRR